MWNQLTVDFSTMGDAVDHHASHRILNRIEDTVAPDTETVGVRSAFQFFCVEGSRSIHESFNGVLDRETHIRWQVSKLFGGARGIEDVVQRGLTLLRHEPWLSG